MYLNFQVMIDLIINTLKNCFLFDEVKITNSSYNNEIIKIWFVADDEQETRYCVEIYTTKEENKIKIKFVSLDIIKRVDDTLFPVIISSYTCNGFNSFETALRNIFSGCWFFNIELEEIRK